MRRHSLIVVLALFGAPAFAGPRAERKITIPDATAAERALFEDARDDKLDSHDPVTAALASSRASAKAREAAAAKWRGFLAELETLGKNKSARDKAQLVLTQLHKQLLTRYDFFQNDMSKVLEDGSYNCVTSAIAYQAAGTALGLDVRGVLVPSHVYVRVVADGVSYDVETTSPSGFLLAQDDEAYQKFLEKMQLDTEKKIGRKITTSAMFSRQETDPIGLIALLYANRGAFAIEQGKQNAAIGHFARSALLAEDERDARDIRDLLLAQAAAKQLLDGDSVEARTLLKFAIRDPGGDPSLRERISEYIGFSWELEALEHLDAKRYESAFSSLTAAREWSTNPMIPHNLKATLNVWGLDELRSKRYEKAADVFYRGMKSFPEDDDFAENLKGAYVEWTTALMAAQSYDAAMSRGRKLMSILPGDATAAEIFAMTATGYAGSFAKKQKWIEALPLFDAAWKAAPQLPGLKVEMVAALTNAGASWEAMGNRPKAVAAWKRALEIDPGASVAKANLDRLSKN